MPNLYPILNNTKWDELRLAMHELNPSPVFRCKNLNGYYSPGNREWYYHFKSGGYEDIIYVDIIAENENQRMIIQNKLADIHVPGEVIETGFRVYGYATRGQELGYIKPTVSD